ncbi:MAG: NAD(P)/FAD-dependent oxidoreductase [Acidobacteria bacterium]|nr:NAD(P)/FAD-dependent oxidoreductase [Acidobacteriota bacterium]
MTTIKTEVAVVGGGPAGSTAAALLASKGVDVTLVERDTFPRDKICGEFLSWDAGPVLDLLGLSGALDAAGARPVRTCRVIAGRREYSFDLPGTARGISRLSLDRMLFERAVILGVRGMTGVTVSRIESSGPTPFIIASGSEGEMRIEAGMIVGAWGRWGRMDLQMKRSFAKETRRRFFGFKRHYVDAADNEEVRLYSFRDGYLGTSPVERGQINICGLVHQNRLRTSRGGWDAVVESLRGESDALRSLFDQHPEPSGEFVSSDPVIFTARKAEHEGTLMIGDAAGLVDPLAGNGMTIGLQSGLLLALHLLSERDDRGRDAWDRTFSRAFHSRFRWSRLVAAMLERPGMMNALLSIVSSPKAGRFLTRRTRADTASIEALADQFASI